MVARNNFFINDSLVTPKRLKNDLITGFFLVDTIGRDTLIF